ncbi:hypothetical protein [Streptomyces fradiae]|uniref:hypothetical protein n=1 Tax=Streptomyces fradiae TaxID=1906 RepID=UPI0036CD1171
MIRPPRPLTRAQQRAANRARHHEARTAQSTARGPKGVAAAWSEHVRRLARDREQHDDPTVWTHLAQTLEWFCSRHPAAVPDNRRSARQLQHWETRLAGLADADPRTLATAWWDRARAVANDHGEAGWNDLALTLKNMADHYAE